jgi:hypothetical protein
MVNRYDTTINQKGNADDDDDDGGVIVLTRRVCRGYVASDR